MWIGDGYLGFRLKLGPFNDCNRNTINICSFKKFPSIFLNEEMNSFFMYLLVVNKD